MKKMNKNSKWAKIKWSTEVTEAIHDWEFLSEILRDSSNQIELKCGSSPEI